jgi:hypothetical protein
MLVYFPSSPSLRPPLPFMWNCSDNLLTYFLNCRLFPSVVGVSQNNYPKYKCNHAPHFGSKMSKLLLPEKYNLNSYFIQRM